MIDEEFCDGGELNGYTVSVKGCPTMAKAYWGNSAQLALETASKDWGIPIERLYIYTGQDE